MDCNDKHKHINLLVSLWVSALWSFIAAVNFQSTHAIRRGLSCKKDVQPCKMVFRGKPNCRVGWIHSFISCPPFLYSQVYKYDTFSLASSSLLCLPPTFFSLSLSLSKSNASLLATPLLVTKKHPFLSSNRGGDGGDGVGWFHVFTSSEVPLIQEAPYENKKLGSQPLVRTREPAVRPGFEPLPKHTFVFHNTIWPKSCEPWSNAIGKGQTRKCWLVFLTSTFLLLNAIELYHEVRSSMPFRIYIKFYSNGGNVYWHIMSITTNQSI